MKTIHIFSAQMPTLESFCQSIDQEGAAGLFFRPLEETELKKFGLNPVGVIRKMKNGYRVAFAYEEKKISSKAIKQELIKRTAHTEINLNRKITKAEKQTIVEEIVHEKSKTADVERTNFYGFYHEKSERFIIDASSEVLAQWAVGTLVKLFGSLKLTTLYIDGVGNGLSENLLSNIENDQQLGFAGFDYADKLNLTHKDLGDAKFTGEYTLEHVADLIGNGYQVELVSLKRDGITFNFTDNFRIKSLKIDSDLNDDIQDQVDHLEGETLIIEKQSLILELTSGIIGSLVDFFDKNKD